MTVHNLLLEAATVIARRDAELLLAHTLRQPRIWLLAHPEAEVNEVEAALFLALTARRAAGEPAQYLTGTQEFFGLELRVTPAVLIPRPETEHLVEAALAWSETQRRPLRFLDIGTGSGAIAIAIAVNLPGVEIFAADISSAALDVARENAVRLGVSERIRFVESDLLSALGSADLPFDAILSNPPYIPSTDAATMQHEVVGHEPHTALFAGMDGLDIYRRLIPAAYAALRPGGLLALEIGFGQREALVELLDGWDNVRFVDDYAAIPRVALAEHP